MFESAKDRRVIGEHEIGAGTERLFEHAVAEIDAQKQAPDLARDGPARLHEQTHVVPILGQIERGQAFEQREHVR